MIRWRRSDLFAADDQNKPAARGSRIGTRVPPRAAEAPRHYGTPRVRRARQQRGTLPATGRQSRPGRGCLPANSVRSSRAVALSGGAAPRDRARPQQAPAQEEEGDAERRGYPFLPTLMARTRPGDYSRQAIGAGVPQPTVDPEVGKTGGQSSHLRWRDRPCQQA